MSQVEYFLKWKGFAHTDNSWEPIDNLGCPELIAAYEENRQKEIKEKETEEDKDKKKVVKEKDKEPEAKPEKDNTAVSMAFLCDSNCSDQEPVFD